MVNTPEEAMSDRAPLEWRRHFYGIPDGLLIAGGVLSALVALGLFALGAVQSHWTIGLLLVGAGLLALGTTVMVAIQVRAFSIRADSVRVVDDAIRVDLRLSHEPAIGMGISCVGLGVSAIGTLAATQSGALPHSHPATTWLPLLLLAMLLAIAVVTLVFQPYARYLEFTPDEFRCDLGIARAVIPWSSIVTLRFYRGEASFWLPGFQDGISFTTTDAARYSGTAFPRLTGSFPVALTAYTVDEDTLYNVITAMVEHPELRELLGSGAGTVLFEGPPRSLRTTMRRSHVWLPWERAIRARLHDTIASGDDCHGGDHSSGGDDTAAPAADTDENTTPA